MSLKIMLPLLTLTLFALSAMPAHADGIYEFTSAPFQVGNPGFPGTTVTGELHLLQYLRPDLSVALIPVSDIVSFSFSDIPGFVMDQSNIVNDEQFYLGTGANGDINAWDFSIGGQFASVPFWATQSAYEFDSCANFDNNIQSFCDPTAVTFDLLSELGGSGQQWNGIGTWQTPEPPTALLLLTGLLALAALPSLRRRLAA